MFPDERSKYSGVTKPERASEGRFVKNFEKKIRKFNPRKYKIATLYCKKNYQNILGRTGFIKALRLSPWAH